MKKQNASLETSFWNIGTRIGVIPYLFEFFEVYYCHPVEEEIVNTNPSATPLIYPQAMLFKVFKEDGRLYHASPRGIRNLDLFHRVNRRNRWDFWGRGRPGQSPWHMSRAGTF